MLNEDLLSNKYKRYKAKVINELMTYDIDINENMHEIESWVRDFYIDGYKPYECADAIRQQLKRNFKGENTKMHINDRLKLAEARRIAREAGYKIQKINEKTEVKPSFKELAEQYGFDVAIDNAISESTDTTQKLRLRSARTIDEATKILSEVRTAHGRMIGNRNTGCDGGRGTVVTNATAFDENDVDLWGKALEIANRTYFENLAANKAAIIKLLSPLNKIDYYLGRIDAAETPSQLKKSVEYGWEHSTQTGFGYSTRYR